MEGLRCRVPAHAWMLLTDIAPKEKELRDQTEPELNAGTGDGTSVPAGAAEGFLTPSGAGSSARPCGLCLSRPARYTCPRCNAPYCGLECYRNPAHSVCSEEFYRDCVTQELKCWGEGEEADRKKMQEILLRLRSSDGGMENVLKDLVEEGGAGVTEQDAQALELLSKLAEAQASGAEEQSEEILQTLAQINGKEDDEVDEDLASKLSGLNIDSLTEEQLWNLLPSCDKEKFRELLEQGGAAGLVVLWRPWWEEHEENAAALIEELQSAETEELKSTEDLRQSHKNPREIPSKDTNVMPQQTQTPNPDSQFSRGTKRPKKTVRTKRSGTSSSDSAAPPISAKIPPLRTITSAPSPLVQFSVVNALFGYAFSLRLFNGDISESEHLLEFCWATLEISESLGSGRVFSSLSEALEGAVLAVSASGHLDRDDPDAAVRALEATAHILTGRCKSDPAGYVLSALSQLRTTFSKARALIKGEEEEWSRKFFLARKKCEFFQSWVMESAGAVRSLARSTWREYNRKHADRQMLQRDKRLVEEWRKGRGKGKVLIEEI